MVKTRFGFKRIGWLTTLNVLLCCGFAALISGCATQQNLDNFDLAAYLKKQEGVAMYAAETRRTLEQEASEGNVESTAKLGVYYLIGYGVDTDQAKAYQYLQTAADKGNARAQLCMGMMTWQGLGAARDPIKAYRYLLLASKGIGQDAQTARELAENIEKHISPKDAEPIKSEAGWAVLLA